MGYALAADVKALLATGEFLTSGGDRIDFGKSYFNLIPDPNGTNTNGTKLTRIRFADEYAGRANFRLVFTNATNFDLYIQASPNDDEVLAGSGDINNTFTVQNPLSPDPASPLDMLEIQPGDWAGGAPVVDTAFIWNTSSVMSEDEFNRCGEFADIIIDGMAMESRQISTISHTSRIFLTNTPDLISVAAMYMWAWMVYSRAFMTAELDKHPKFQWWMIAKNTVGQYIRTLRKWGTRWLSRRPVFAMSKTDKTGSFLFGIDMYLRQPVAITQEAIMERLRDFEDSKNYIGLGETTRDDFDYST